MQRELHQLAVEEELQRMEMEKEELAHHNAKRLDEEEKAH